jgi:hypothetical protein
VVSAQEDADAFVQRLTDALDREADQAGTSSSVGTPSSVGTVDDAETSDGVGRVAELGPAAAVVAQLRAPGTWTSPPADLRARILAAAAQESAAAQPSGTQHSAAQDSTARPAPDPEPAPAPVVPLVPRWRRLAWAVPLAAAAAAAFAFAVLAIDDVVSRPDHGTTYTAVGTALAPRAGADVSVATAGAGFSVGLAAHDLPPAAPGSYYAAFLSGPRGVVPLGSFHNRKAGKPITMWSGVDPKDYPRFTVTLQREGAAPGPSDQIVLTGTLAG